MTPQPAPADAAALAAALGPWLHHRHQGCASTEGYGVKDGVRLTPQKPCDCGLDEALAALPVHPPAPPEGTRLVIMDVDLLTSLGSRTHDGYAITAEWGEPDANGWYTPTFTVHHDQPLAAPPAPPEPLCPAGCGCKWPDEEGIEAGATDADRRDCACDGPCCYDSWAEFMEASAAPPAPLPLDAAWAEAEAALPLVGWVDPLDGRWVIPQGTWSIDIRREESGDGYFEPAVEGFWATGKVDGPDRPFAVRGDLGPTPADALRSLAASMLAHRGLATPEPTEDGQP